MIENAYDPSDPGSVTLALARYGTVRYAIPERLERAGQGLSRVVDQTTAYGLGLALRFDTPFYAVVVDDLLSAAERIREAARLIEIPKLRRDAW